MLLIKTSIYTANRLYVLCPECRKAKNKREDNVNDVGKLIAFFAEMKAANPKFFLDIQIDDQKARSEEHTYELQSIRRISYAVFCLKKKFV